MGLIFAFGSLFLYQMFLGKIKKRSYLEKQVERLLKYIKNFISRYEKWSK
jgi:hypothetical protein